MRHGLNTREGLAGSSSSIRRLIPATLIKEYFFCPRIPYIVMNSSHVQEEFHFMERGKEVERDLAKKAIEKLNAQIIAEKIEGTHEELGIYGVIDYVIRKENALHVLELKNTSYKETFLGHRFQAVAYVLIARRCGYPVRSAIIYYGESETIVEILPTWENIRTLLSVINAINRFLKVGMPRIKSSRCGVCSYRHICLEI